MAAHAEASLRLNHATHPCKPDAQLEAILLSSCNLSGNDQFDIGPNGLKLICNCMSKINKCNSILCILNKCYITEFHEIHMFFFADETHLTRQKRLPK